MMILQMEKNINFNAIVAIHPYHLIVKRLKVAAYVSKPK